ncbi:helix-turn-helix domain-containing protein [Alistipes putredinis]
MADMTQSELAKKSGVNIRQIQRVELGEAEAGNLTAKNLLAIADALGVDAKFLL